MSDLDLDLTEAIEEAFQDISLDEVIGYGEVMLVIVPLIEQQVRSQITAKIEVEMRRHDHSQVGFSAVGDAYAHAARIARGES